MSNKSSVCSVTLGNLDLPYIDNGYLGDQIDLPPFDKVFQCANIMLWWIAVRFMSMTCKSLENDKV